VRKAGSERGPVVELHQEELVFRIGKLEELGGGLPGFLQLGAHTTAAIEDQADRERGIFAGKVRQFLFDLVLE